jgi:hypothetical protein
MPKANRGWSKSSVGVAVIAGFFVCQPAHAFKMTTHVASANLTEDKLATMVAASGTGTLVFIVKGQRRTPYPQQTGNACTAARAAAHRPRLFDGLGRARARRDAVALGLLSQRSAWSTFVLDLSGRATCHS